MCCAAVQNNRTRSFMLTLQLPTPALSVGERRQHTASGAGQLPAATMVDQTIIFPTDNRAT